jgi:excinuclease ABC subunit A
MPTGSSTSARKAGEGGGQILYSGPPEGLREGRRARTRGATCSTTRRRAAHAPREPPAGCAGRRHPQQPARAGSRVSAGRDDLRDRRVRLRQIEPGQPGAGRPGDRGAGPGRAARKRRKTNRAWSRSHMPPRAASSGGMEGVRRLVRVDQKPIGRTPRSNLATYTGLFDQVRKLFAATPAARKRRYDAGRFSFNVAKGRCEHCAGRGLRDGRAAVPAQRLRAMPDLRRRALQRRYAGTATGEATSPRCWRMTVDEAAHDFFEDEEAVARPLQVLREVGLGYLRLGQSATELSGGEAQRIKLATELQRATRGGALVRAGRADHRPAPARRRPPAGPAATGWSTPAIPSSWSSTRCAWPPPATG